MTMCTFYRAKCSFVNIYVAVTQPGVSRIVHQSNISSCSHCLFVFCFIVSSRQQCVDEILLKMMCFVHLTSKIPTDCSDSQRRGARWKSRSKLGQHIRGRTVRTASRKTSGGISQHKLRLESTLSLLSINLGLIHLCNLLVLVKKRG